MAHHFVERYGFIQAPELANHLSDIMWPGLNRARIELLLNSVDRFKNEIYKKVRNVFRKSDSKRNLT